MTTVAAIIFAIATAGAVAFQLALALGAPWGRYAMGGRFAGRFPPTMRVAALVQAAVLALLAVIVLSHAGLVLPSLAEGLPWLVWAAVAFSAVSLLLNAISRSPDERRLWVPVTAVMFATALAVAVTG